MEGKKGDESTHPGTLNGDKGNGKREKERKRIKRISGKRKTKKRRSSNGRERDTKPKFWAHQSQVERLAEANVKRDDGGKNPQCWTKISLCPGSSSPYLLKPGNANEMKKHFSPSSSLASCKTNYVCGSQTCTTRTTWGKLCVSQSFVASSSKLCQSEWCSCLLACLLVGSGCEYVCCCNSLVHRAISKVCSTSLCYFEFISQSLDGEDAETHMPRWFWW